MKPLIFLLLCCCTPLHADDSALVHGLAHGASGALVVSAVNIGAQGKLRGWKATAIELGLALAVDELYEYATYKDATTTWQHNGDAVLGAAIVGFQINFH
jgi:hypothetical protein